MVRPCSQDFWMMCGCCQKWWNLRNGDVSRPSTQQTDAEQKDYERKRRQETGGQSGALAYASGQLTFSPWNLVSTSVGIITTMHVCRRGGALNGVIHYGVPLSPKSMTAQGTWYWAVRGIRSKLSADERQVQRTRNQIERENYEHEHYEKTGRQSGTGHRRFKQHLRGDRPNTRGPWRRSRPLPHRITPPSP